MSTGKILSTEDTYKSHIQILESVPELSPKVQDGPMKMKLKPPKKHADPLLTGSDGATRHEVGQDDEPVDDRHSGLSPPVVDGLSVSLSDGDRNEERVNGRLVDYQLIFHYVGDHGPPHLPVVCQLY